MTSYYNPNVVEVEFDTACEHGRSNGYLCPHCMGLAESEPEPEPYTLCDAHDALNAVCHALKDDQLVPFVPSAAEALRLAETACQAIEDQHGD